MTNGRQNERVTINKDNTTILEFAAAVMTKWARIVSKLLQ